MMRRIGSAYLVEAVRVLQDGGVIVFPTETSYGMGCDATNEKAVKRILAIKGRSPEKGFPVILPPEADPSDYIMFDERARQLAEKYWPGPLNIIAERNPTSLLAPLCAREGGQSVRKSSHPVAQALARGLGKPLVATSANPSGIAAAYTADQAMAFFSAEPCPDLLVDGGELPLNAASTTIVVTADGIQVLRQGSIVVSV